MKLSWIIYLSSILRENQASTSYNQFIKIKNVQIIKEYYYN